MSSSFHYINLDYLEMMSDGDQNTQKILLEMLLEELPQAVAEMKQINAVQDWQELQNASHKMKSTLAFVGNDQLFKANKKILETLKSGSEFDFKQEIQVLDQLVPKVMDELQKVYARLRP